MPWWMWMLLGLSLFIAEVSAPTGFYMMFFGIGAILVGLLVAIGAIEKAWVEWLFFSVLSVGTVLTLRRPLNERFGFGGGGPKVDALVGEIAVASQAVPPGGVGKAELRGTSWNVHNLGTDPLAAGRRCRVERVEGLTLFVRAE